MTAVYVLGRILLAAIFLISGAIKVMQYSGQVAFAGQAGVPFPAIAIALAAAVEVGAGICVVLGYRIWLAAWVLVAYLVPVSVIFHSNFADPNQIANFMKNVALIGGLMILAWAGRYQPAPMQAKTAETDRREVLERMRS